MKIYHLPVPIPVPDLFESIGAAILLCHRKKKYGTAFRKIKLHIGNKPAKNRCAIVDPEDYAKLAQYHWQLVEEAGKPCYAVRLVGRKIVSMHRQIMKSPKGKIVHHEDGNGLNNTKKNLQIVTIAENNRYCRKRGKPTSSKYKGVSIHRRSGKWQASIKYNGIHKSLGSYDTQEEAARAYDEAAKIYHGQYAVLNFPPAISFSAEKKIKSENFIGAGSTPQFPCPDAPMRRDLRFTSTSGSSLRLRRKRKLNLPTAILFAAANKIQMRGLPLAKNFIGAGSTPSKVFIQPTPKFFPREKLSNKS